MGLSVRADQRSRGHDRFVLNFQNETLRVDVPASLWRPPRTWTVRFDDVRAVERIVERGGASLYVACQRAHGRPLWLRLLKASPPEEREVLDRVRRLLASAFGLTLPTS
jgi:hypothetical protein